ncbi:MAG: hypothetical protein JJU02_13555 [Cryomorphaceae bacterium]|nr:hypothetical protein [Cryomorphaceae bacterium]
MLHYTKYFFLIARFWCAAAMATSCAKSDENETLDVPAPPIFEPQYTRFDPIESYDFSLFNENLITKNLIEISGIVSGRKNNGVVYMHEDSGNRNVVFVFDTTGVFIGELVLVGVQNRDWEDIAIGPGPKEGINYIYVGDIGDNRGGRPHLFIHRFEEPDFEYNEHGPFKMEITDFETIKYQYPDGARDAETLMIHPQTKDLIVITKREVNVHVYQLPYPQKTNGENATIFFRGQLPFRTIVGGDISPDGNEILIKDYGAVYHWTGVASNPIASMFENAPTSVAYVPEVQGESVGWTWRGDGYFTITETEKIDAEPILYHYKR